MAGGVVVLASQICTLPPDETDRLKHGDQNM